MKLKCNRCKRFKCLADFRLKPHPKNQCDRFTQCKACDIDVRNQRAVQKRKPVVVAKPARVLSMRWVGH